ncbi:hypothetical protein Rsub_03054 [Raphidocelis subcapitata]|uniref:PNPLA domain-containing protein n=1 Tax=Raphidocelis subcapitata TaxID=307507 RepID=A0A2V0NYU9_9CHLO|nr:hypothetical protein Rsub_03054 [Raphidocelis subcapitata]|eukprot:GBF90753.1 hypothetical protein Rsub_03054 [Raphidocelis subcapitata]
MAVAVPAAALAAAQAGSIGAGFSGGGFILPFLLGVIDMLYRELGVMNADMPVAGASAGAIAAAAAAGALPFDAVRSEVDALAARCRAKGNCYGTLHDELMATARQMVTDASAKRIMDHGRLYMSLMHLPQGSLKPYQALESKFQGKDDVITAVGATCYIPGYAGPSPTIKFRGQPVFDGSFGGPGAGFLPCPPGVRYCVRVSAMPAHVTLAGVIGTILRGGPQSQGIAARAALDILTSADVAGTLLQTALGRQGGAPFQGAAELAAAYTGFWELRTPGEGEADIFPGRRHALPVGEFEWVTRMPIPARSAADNQAMFDLGRTEALSWAQEAGFPAALAKAGRSG